MTADAVIYFLSRRNEIGPVALCDWTLSFPGDRLRVGGWVVNPDGRYPVGLGVLVRRLDLPGRAALVDLQGDCDVQMVHDDEHYLEYTFSGVGVGLDVPRNAVGTGEEALRLRAENGRLRSGLLHLAAEAHRRKWAYDLGEDAHGQQIPSPAFDSLHRLGNELKALLDQTGANR